MTMSCSQAQRDSSIYALQQLPSKYFSQVDSKIDKYSSRLSDKTEKTLTRLSRWEEKIHALLLKASPETAASLFAPGQPTFGSLLQKLQHGEAIEQGYKARYDSYRDTLATGMQYIAAQKAPLVNKVNSADKVNKHLTALDQEVANSEATQKFIKERKKQLFDASLKYIGTSKYLSKINKEAYYYTATLKNYKDIFNDPQKTEATAKEILSRIPAFQQFLQNNSALASLFGSPSSEASAVSLAGLQTRTSVNTLIQGQLAVGGPNAMQQFQQNMQEAQSQLNNLKDKVLKAGGVSSDMDIPDFKPNMQKTKTFSQRLEKGFNLQFVKPSSLSSTNTADIGLSLGYKLNDKSVIGLGISYKLGMGSVQHIEFTHEGIGLRSYIDWQILAPNGGTGGAFYVSGGYELNHNESFKKFTQLKNIAAWQPAGLVGLTKTLKIRSKLARETKLQLLYDVLCRSHVPATAPWVFRVGYQF
jgi:hypothetical protein